MSYFIKYTAVCLSAVSAFSVCLAPFNTYASDEKYVIPSGECVGVKIYTDGPMVVNSESVTGVDGKTINLAVGYGIKNGDIIKKIDGIDVMSNEMVSEYLSESKGDITLTLSSDGGERDIEVTPVITADGPKLGLWLRDSTAGLGTITYTDNNTFAALGHGICDIDTGDIMPIEHGIIQNCTITSITKGESGSPGAITGIIDGANIGSITKNTEHGLYGTITAQDEQSSRTPIPVAASSEVRTGDASILCDVDGKGVMEYSIKITRVMPSKGSHDMVIEITDKDLTEKTGGIVQGMSGSPIIQDNKFVGALTHVFVNDPLSGYGILAENMMG